MWIRIEKGERRKAEGGRGFGLQAKGLYFEFPSEGLGVGFIKENSTIFIH